MQPCEWDIADIDCEGWSDLSEDQQGLYTAMAVEFLWNLTGRSFGLCPVELRPCKTSCTEGQSTFGGLPQRGTVAGFTPTLIGGKWYNVSCMMCGDACGCDSTPAFVLPGPVDSIERITIDGQVLDPSAYRVDSRKFLVRLDGGAWPTCQTMSRDITEPGTWQVDYTRGVPVPVGGQVAAAVLACEFSKVGTKECRLPRRVQSISRQGVTMAFLDSFEDLDKGHTGIWEIDSWVTSVMKRPVPSVVLSPDYRPAKGRTTTWRDL